MEITPAASLPAPADRIEAVADYMLDGLSNGEMSMLMIETRHELLEAGYTWDEISTF